MNDDLLRHYKARRVSTFANRMEPATESLRAARDRLSQDKKAYSNEWPWQRGANNVTRQEKKQPSDNYAWIENTESAGLRFVGYADEVCKSIDHRGWYMDEFQDEVLRGAVWQLPARRGVARFIAGYEDPINKGAAFVDLDIISDEGGAILRDYSYREPKYRKQSQQDANDSAKRDAALRADSIAERIAESEREYNAAWQAGSEWSDLADEIARERADVLALLIESRPERRAKRETATPRICAAIRATVQNGLDAIAKMRKRRAELFNQYGDEDGFAEFLPRA